MRLKMLSERQKEILMTSVKLAAAKGVQAITMKNISSEIGISDAALYRHFQSKRDIMLGIIELFSVTSDRDFESSLNSSNSPLSEIESLILKRVEHFSQFPEIAYIMLSVDIFMQDEELKSAAISSIHKHKEFILSLIIKGQAKGEIRGDAGPKELARVILGSLRLLLTQWILTDYSFDLKAEFEMLWKTICLLLKA